MKFADLDHRLRIEEPMVSCNDSGGRDVSWRPGDSVWAEIEPISGEESPLAHSLRSKLTHRITMRYRPGLRPSMRFSCGQRRFDIVAIFPGMSRRRWSICYCTEVPPQ